MTIKHAIPKIEWALNYYITQSRQELKEELELETRCGRESHARSKEPWGPDELGSREVADKM